MSDVTVHITNIDYPTVENLQTNTVVRMNSGGVGLITYDNRLEENVVVLIRGGFQGRVSSSTGSGIITNSSGIKKVIGRLVVQVDE